MVVYHGDPLRHIQDGRAFRIRRPVRIQEDYERLLGHELFCSFAGYEVVHARVLRLFIYRLERVVHLVKDYACVGPVYLADPRHPE